MTKWYTQSCNRPVSQTCSTASFAPCQSVMNYAASSMDRWIREQKQVFELQYNVAMTGHPSQNYISVTSGFTLRVCAGTGGCQGLCTFHYWLLLCCQGCYDELHQWIDDNTLIIIAVIGSLALVQVSVPPSPCIIPRTLPQFKHPSCVH